MKGQYIIYLSFGCTIIWTIDYLFCPLYGQLVLTVLFTFHSFLFTFPFKRLQAYSLKEFVQSFLHSLSHDLYLLSSVSRSLFPFSLSSQTPSLSLLSHSHPSSLSSILSSLYPPSPLPHHYHIVAAFGVFLSPWPPPSSFSLLDHRITCRNELRVGVPRLSQSSDTCPLTPT